MFFKRIAKTRSGFGALVLGTGLALSTLAFATDDPELPKPWPERLWRSLHNAADHTFVELSSALFDSLDKLDAELFKFPGNSKLGVEVRRDVLDNFDLLNTYTVIDRVKIQAESRPLSKITTWTEDVQTSGLGTPYIGLVFEPQASIEWTNVRQVRALDFKKEPSARVLAKQARIDAEIGAAADKSRTAGEPKPEPSPDPDLSELNPDIPIAFVDPSIRARFSRLPNLVAFPFRVPLHRRDVSKMKDGEILGYAFDGQVEVGVSAGLKVIPTLNVLHAGIDLRGTVLLHGRYQISVLREDARHARVKLTRLKEKGTKGSIKIGIERKNVYDGVMLFKGTPVEIDHVAKWNLNLVPFDFESSHIRSDQFDVVYRYDLDDPTGKAAFHKAVLGKFAESEGITGGLVGDTSKPVEKLLSRDGERYTAANSVRVDLAGLLRLDFNRKRESLEATLELPDGTHHLLEAVREKKKQQKTVFGAATENGVRRMTLYMDSELYAKNDPESIFVIAEITREDSNTGSRELNRYIGDMEKFLRKPDLLPDAAAHKPGKRWFLNPNRQWYGRSSFYYGYSLSLEEVGAFLRTDRATVEDLARKYLGLDRATSFIEAWATARTALDAGATAPELFRALQGVFASRYGVEPLTNILFDTIPSRLVDYFVTAQNVAFGRIQERGKTVTSVEKALTNTDRELGFETYNQRLKQDSEAVVKEIHVDAGPGGVKKLRFTLSHDPENVFFRLFQVTGLKKQLRLAEVAVNNRNHRFRAGENEILLDPDSLDLLTAKLSRDLRRGEFYNLSIAYSRTTDRYGPVASNRFGIDDDPYPSSKPAKPSPAN
ncbi:MAG: hypothetical protein JST04_05920 [Bdellovibrionales bacterium]|nr:hypothetical protein [Bdellovibrionales bacterium]